MDICLTSQAQLCLRQRINRKNKSMESEPNGTEHPGRKLTVRIWQVDSSPLCRRKSVQTSEEWQQ